MNRLLAIVLWCTLTAFPAAAEKRIALVIGNNDYPSLTAEEQLKRAVNDANAVGDALEAIGFEVTRGENLGRGQLLGSLFATANRLDEDDIALFFYAGHGVSIDGANYLLPSDIPPADSGAEDLVKASAISEAMVVETLKNRGVRVAIVVLDACRDNPFSQGGTRAFGDATRGLSRPPSVQPQGVFGLYSAGFGEQALDSLGDDDDDPNSVFTRILVPALQTPGQSLLDIAYSVNEEVARLADTVGHEQNPAYYDQARARDVFLAERTDESEVATAPVEEPAARENTLQAPADPCAAAQSHFDAARAIGRVEALEDHIRRFGDCQFVALADMMIESLRNDAPESTEEDVAALEMDESAPAAGPGDTTPQEAPAGLPEAPPAPAAADGWLGLRTIPFTPEVAEPFGLPGDYGVIVAEFEEGSPSASAGIEIGDIILEFDGHTVLNPAHLDELVAANAPGNTVYMRLLHQGDPVLRTLVVGSASATSEPLPADRRQEADLATAECNRLVNLPNPSASDLAAGVTACERSSFLLYMLVAEAGDAEGQYMVGTLYEQGKGVEQSDNEAVRWYQLAVGQDYGDGHWGLGLMYQAGRAGLPVDVTQAVHHLMRALWLKSGAARSQLIEGQGSQLSSEVRSEIQNILKDTGFYAGSIDGVFGQTTIDALEAYSASG